jgi:hypothetical protein
MPLPIIFGANLHPVCCWEQRVLKIDLGRSFIIGDSLSDLAAGRAGRHPAWCAGANGTWRAGMAEGGETQFAEWRSSQDFTPRRVENAAAAVDKWLEELMARTDAR